MSPVCCPTGWYSHQQVLLLAGETLIRLLSLWSLQGPGTSYSGLRPTVACQGTPCVRAGRLQPTCFCPQITAVCNFFTYIRYIQQGLVRQDGECPLVAGEGMASRGQSGWARTAGRVGCYSQGWTTQLLIQETSEGASAG